MKKMILTMIATAAILAVSVAPAIAEPPFATGFWLNNTNATADFAIAEAVQPVRLNLSGVLPLSVDGQTVTVSRVRGTATEVLYAFSLGSNVASSSTVLTNASWILLGDELRIAGPTNALLELQGNR